MKNQTLEQKIENEERSGVLSRLRDSKVFKYIPKALIPLMAAGWMYFSRDSKSNTLNSQTKSSVLMFVDTDTYNQLKDRIDRYAGDIKNEVAPDMNVYLYAIQNKGEYIHDYDYLYDKWEDISEIRDVIIKHYNSSTERLLGSVLMGNIPKAQFDDNIPNNGWELNDLPFQYLAKSDIFVDSNRDGKFDLDKIGPIELQVWTVRLELRPTGWNGINNLNQQKIELLREYLDKDHYYRTDRSKQNQKRLYFIDMDNSGFLVLRDFKEELKISNCARDRDSDCDGISDEFEIKYQSTGLNPSIKNERYAILFHTFGCGEHIDISNTYKFLIEKEKFRPENIAEIYGINATHSDFRRAVDEIAAKAGENSLVYIEILSHGHGFGENGESSIMAFNSGKNLYDPTSSDPCAHGETVQYREIGELLNKIKCNKMLISVLSCAYENAVEPLSRGVYPRVVISTPFTSFIERCLSRDGRWSKEWCNKYTDELGTYTPKDNYISIKDVIECNHRFGKPSNCTDCRVKVSDPHNIALTFYFGDWEIK